jgi:hypothetical protein
MKRVNHEKVLGNIIDLLESRRNHQGNGPIIETMYYTMPANEHEEMSFLNYWHDKVDHVRLGGPISISFADFNQNNRSIKPRQQTCIEIWERMTFF